MTPVTPTESTVPHANYAIRTEPRRTILQIVEQEDCFAVFVDGEWTDHQTLDDAEGWAFNPAARAAWRARRAPSVATA